MLDIEKALFIKALEDAKETIDIVELSKLSIPNISEDILKLVRIEEDIAKTNITYLLTQLDNGVDIRNESGLLERFNTVITLSTLSRLNAKRIHLTPDADGY